MEVLSFSTHNKHESGMCVNSCAEQGRGKAEILKSPGDGWRAVLGWRVPSGYPSIPDKGQEDVDSLLSLGLVILTRPASVEVNRTPRDPQFCLTFVTDFFFFTQECGKVDGLRLSSPRYRILNGHYIESLVRSGGGQTVSH